MLANIRHSTKQSPEDREWNLLHHQTGLLARKADRLVRPQPALELNRSE